MESDEERANRRLGSIVGGQWTLEGLLGAGGVGAVYSARDTSGRAAAVKILHSELAYKQDVRERFLREGALANNINHEGALRIWDQGTTEDGSGYLVMELLEGETLTDLIRREGYLDAQHLLELMDQVLDVLVVAHEAGIIHRDIKPDNLFVTKSGQLKILDYGLARRLADIKGDFKTKTGLALGTLPYMAPEQALGRRGQMDGRVDVFAIGAIAFRVLARRRVHEAESEAELLVKMASQPAPSLGSVAPKTPAAIQQIVDLALAFNKEARYPDARTMQADIRDVLAGRPPSYASTHLSRHNDATRVEMALPLQATPPSLQPSVRRVARTEPLPASRSGTELMPASVPEPVLQPGLLAPVGAGVIPLASAALPSPPVVSPQPAQGLPMTNASSAQVTSSRGVLWLTLLVGGVALLGACVFALFFFSHQVSDAAGEGQPGPIATPASPAADSDLTAHPSPQPKPLTNEPSARGAADHATATRAADSAPAADSARPDREPLALESEAAAADATVEAPAADATDEPRSATSSKPIAHSGAKSTPSKPKPKPKRKGLSRPKD